MLEMNDGLLVCGSSSGPVLRCWWTFSSKQDEKAPWSGDKPSASARLWPIACDRWFSPKKAPFAQKINNIYIYIFYSLDRRNKSKSREFQSRVWTPRDWSWSHSPMTYKIFRFFLQSHDISWNFVTKHFWQRLKKKMGDVNIIRIFSFETLEFSSRLMDSFSKGYSTCYSCGEFKNRPICFIRFIIIWIGY